MSKGVYHWVKVGQYLEGELQLNLDGELFYLYLYTYISFSLLFVTDALFTRKQTKVLDLECLNLLSKLNIKSQSRTFFSIRVEHFSNPQSVKCYDMYACIHICIDIIV